MEHAAARSSAASKRVFVRLDICCDEQEEAPRFNAAKIFFKKEGLRTDESPENDVNLNVKNATRTQRSIKTGTKKPKTTLDVVSLSRRADHKEALHCS